MLPVEAVIPELKDALSTKGAAVLTAEPGAGKTTIVPLRLLDQYERILMLEPRRVVTRAAARRLASLLGEEVGQTVGYRTRDDRRVSEATRLEVVTEGILTRRLQRDGDLAGVGLVIFDEFHERSLHADLGLALTLDVRRRTRPDLQLLVMSATLDVDRVARLLDGAPVVRSEGRAHPIDIRWRPRKRHDRIDEAMASAIALAVRDDPGDVLAFLPGAGEIHRTADRLVEANVDADVIPLYGALNAGDQDRALAPRPDGARRRVVLSTDIAETSLTVPGVRIVVDSGLARVPRFDAGTGMTRLQTVAASKASVDQRAGRAGRLEPGVAYRLWSKMEHAARRPHIDPEIMQVDLAPLALDLAAWPHADDLVWLDAPPSRALQRGRQLLEQLGALDPDGSLTDTGRAMTDLPLHPRLARMVAGTKTWLACLVAALLEDRDILRGNPNDLPASIALRLELMLDPEPRTREIGNAQRRARDLARRAGITTSEHGDVDVDDAGRVLALGYPDRIARNRNGTTPGQFKLADGTTAWLPASDALATAATLVFAESDGNKRSARIRLAAPLREV